MAFSVRSVCFREVWIYDERGKRMVEWKVVI